MKIAVIGASGLIGNRVVETAHLTDRAEVVPIVRRAAALALPARFALDARIADALDASALTAALHGCDAVVHAAGGEPAAIQRMPEVLCRAAADAGVRRLIYLSSAAVHGASPPAGTDETSPLHTHHESEYSNARVVAERRFLAECQRLGLAGYALRPAIVYGPRSRWIADLAADLIGGRAWLYRRGLGIFNGIGVDNLVHAIFRCLEMPQGAGQAYLLGDAETTTWAEFYLTAALELDVSPRGIHDVQEFPAFSPSWRERAERAVTNPLVQRALPLLPSTVRRGTKSLFKAWADESAEDAWSLPRPPAPRITPELAELQRCAWKLPFSRAHRVLGYQPPVKFSEGMRRSFAWWRFAAGRPLATA